MPRIGAFLSLERGCPVLPADRASVVGVLGVANDPIGSRQGNGAIALSGLRTNTLGMAFANRTMTPPKASLGARIERGCDNTAIGVSRMLMLAPLQG